MALLRSYLFAPGHDEKLLGKVFAAGADAVVLDLEDAVAPPEKARAREQVRRALEQRRRGSGPEAWVRINGLESREWGEDVEAAVSPALAGVRVPKAESVAALRALDEALARAEAKRGLSTGSVAVACTIESAAGALAARELAGGPRVRHLTFGAADFAADVGADPGPLELETLAVRAHLVTASRAAGIAPPVASVFRRMDDEEGLRRSTEAARRLGFFGRSVIHPRQIAVVHEVFTPRPEEVRRAEEIVKALEKAGGGAAVAADGQFVDAAVARRARAILELARSLAERERVG
jgi:citrate lyase subunit beta/citryl-CoA lyase